MALGEDALAGVDRDPARIEEHALAVLHDAAAAAEQLHLLGQAVRDRHGAHIVPERRVDARGRVIMQDQEIADAIIFKIDQRG